MDDIIEKLQTVEIARLKRKLKEYKENYVPNQDLKIIKTKLVNRIKHGGFEKYTLDEAKCSLTLNQILDMLYNLIGKGNFFILLCGSQCNRDISNDCFNDKRDTDDILHDYYIKRLFDNRIDEDKCYLIALDNLFQYNIPDDNIAVFIRE